MTVYLCGPMTGLPDYNYPAFHAAAADLRRQGRAVLNPAENFGGSLQQSRPEYLRAAIAQVLIADSLCLLPGWEESAGARLEEQIAKALGLPVWGYGDPSMEIYDDNMPAPLPAIDTPMACGPDADAPPIRPMLTARAGILDEAKALITGDRNDEYGGPMPDFTRTADALSALGYRRVTDDGMAVVLRPSDVAVAMVALKLSRLQHSRGKRDTWADLAGYAGLGYECTTEEGE